jgi:putative peptide zinc metalloprotease protein
MLIPSSNRPIPLVRRSDLQISAISGHNDDHVLVKDPLALTYFQLPILQYTILSALDGRRSLDEIVAQVRHASKSSAITVGDVFQIILDLASKRLIWSQRPGAFEKSGTQPDQQGWHRLWMAVRNPLFIRLPGFCPGPLLRRAICFMRWIYSKPAIIGVFAFVLFSWFCCLFRADDFARELLAVPAFLSGDGLLTLWLVVGGLKVIHELSHGLACEHFGARCQSIGFALLFFSPCMYCDVSDAWLLARKRHRIAISLAGIYVELFLSALGFWFWRYSGPGILHQISFQVFLAGSISTLMFNANPLLKFDGYYVLSDLLEVPNLYQRSRQLVWRVVHRVMLGIRIHSDVASERQSRSVLLIYGLASLIYQVPMLVGLYLYFVRFFESLGLATLPLCYLLVNFTLAISRVAIWSRQIAQKESSARPSSLNLLGTFVALTMLLLGIWFFPLGSWGVAPVVIELRSATPVYVDAPGTVRQVYVSDGDFVEEGTLLIQLEDLSLEQERVALEGLKALHEIDFRMAQSIGDPDLMTLAKTASESIADQLDHARAEQQRLQLRAETSGIVVSARESDPQSRQSPQKSGQDSATRLNSRLIGTHLARRTLVCEIAPRSSWQAQIWVDQRQRPCLSPDQPISIKLDAFAGINLHGRIQSIGAANELEIPAALSTRFGGPYFAKSSAEGELAVAPIYCATIVLDHVDLPIQPGMRGSGRYRRPAITVGSWIVEELHRAFIVR